MYDFVIVGAGSAGCVLAARLSEDRDVRVLLLEAGPPDSGRELRVPAAMFGLFKGTYDWDYVTAPQQAAANRGVYWPRGKTLGGCSSTNGQLYVRGHRLDYDSWQDQYGCKGWTYENLLPYFLKAEDQQHGKSAYHAVGGPMRVEDQRYSHQFNRDFVTAAVAAGFPASADFNGVVQEGFGSYQVNHRRGRRWSNADGYLRPALRRPNLTVETDALVISVLFEGNRAAGVRYVREGRVLEARAEAEVLLCGGAVNTPQVLMLSGIGPAPHLREYGIKVRHDSPNVGRGLQDHPLCHVQWRAPALRNLWEERTPANVLRWLALRRGPLASNGLETGGFVRTKPALAAPDVQFGAAASAFVNEGLSMPEQRCMDVLVIAIDVKSRGQIRLRSADPSDKPVIDPGYLTEPSDLETLMSGVHIARDIAAKHPLARYASVELAPGGEIADGSPLRTWIRQNVGTIYHPTSSAAMGGADSAVCDPDLLVRGVDGLRVVDASVMPAVPRGNTNAPVTALAELAADLVRGRTQ